MKQVARADAKLQGAKDVRAEDSLAGDWRYCMAPVPIDDELARTCRGLFYLILALKIPVPTR
jgi:hypothetical protein